MNKFLQILFYPFKLICYLLIYFYKIFISPLLPNTCIYYPSCSTYTLQSIKEFGVIKGIYLGAKRILRCRPNKIGGYDPIEVNIKGEIKWLL